MISIVIADDHAAFRRSLREILESEEDFLVLAEADNGAAALRYVETLSPSIAVLDVRMPEMSGIDVARAVQSKQLPTSTIILTMYKDEESFIAAMTSGVRGYVIKDDVISEIVNCIREVREGRLYTAALFHSAKLRLMLGRKSE